MEPLKRHRMRSVKKKKKTNSEGELIPKYVYLCVCVGGDGNEIKMIKNICMKDKGYLTYIHVSGATAQKTRIHLTDIKIQTSIRLNLSWDEKS